MAKTKTATGPTKRPLDADYLRALIAAGYVLAPGSSPVPQGSWRPRVLDPAARYADADAAVEAFTVDPFAWPTISVVASNCMVIHGEAEELEPWLERLGAGGAPRYHWTERSRGLGRGKLAWTPLGGTTLTGGDTVERVAVVFRATVERRCVCCSSPHEHRCQVAPGSAALIVANDLGQSRPVAWVEGATEAPVWPVAPYGKARTWPKHYPRPGAIVAAGPTAGPPLLAPWTRVAWADGTVEPAVPTSALLEALEQPDFDTSDQMWRRPVPIIGARVGYDPATEVPPRPTTPTEPPHGLEVALDLLADHSPASAALGQWLGRRLAGGALDQAAADQAGATMAQLADADGAPQWSAIRARVGKALEGYLKRRAVYAEELATLTARATEWDETYGWSKAL